MRKSIFMVLLGLILAVPAFAINKAPLKELIVASDGEFTSITAALASITNASDTNRYVIKVMPGIYNESIQMKSYVDMVGSGKENTKITATAVLATVQGADNSSIENIWVENTNPDASLLPAAILNDNTSMTINKVKATMVNPTGSPEAFGILNKGASSKPVISNCIVEVRALNMRGAIGIGAKDGSSMTVRNCDIMVDTTGASYSFWNVGVFASFSSGTGSSVKDSVIKVTGANYNDGVEGDGGLNLLVSNSRIEAIGTANTLQNETLRGSVTVTNSEIVMSGTATTNCAVYGGGMIGGSLIDGIICGTPKIVNNWDGAFNPIPNQ